MGPVRHGRSAGKFCRGISYSSLKSEPARAVNPRLALFPRVPSIAVRATRSARDPGRAVSARPARGACLPAGPGHCGGPGESGNAPAHAGARGVCGPSGARAGAGARLAGARRFLGGPRRLRSAGAPGARPVEPGRHPAALRLDGGAQQCLRRSSGDGAGERRSLVRFCDQTLAARRTGRHGGGECGRRRHPPGERRAPAGVARPEHHGGAPEAAPRHAGRRIGRHAPWPRGRRATPPTQPGERPAVLPPPPGRPPCPPRRAPPPARRPCPEIFPAGVVQPRGRTPARARCRVVRCGDARI